MESGCLIFLVDSMVQLGDDLVFRTIIEILLIKRILNIL